ncbi:Predicted oxidoreductase [Halorubrum xinjiangense]|uniref:Predicted oxidoreductase n=1 Tax=Halorubrum xinjiangense TaxID=261291 RepID=A0A1G7LLI1_9EURY|nr:aldo/keto reductase [Halorubrum xinjiangense]SDF49860.1 Predicted oxidoreductase [Halorubrum xinjiangense]
MEYTTLGSSGTKVSRIGIGTNTFGGDAEWHLSAEEAQDVVDTAIDHGINFFDTANAYNTGESERVLGEALDGYDRDRQVIATKVYFQMDDDDPNSGGLSRKAIEQELRNSLDRLGTDAIDLYQIHRWDDETPIAETLRTLDDAVRRGDVRHVGASSMWAHQFAEALHVAERDGYEPFVTMQDHYNLAYREEEREMVPFCERKGVGLIPWSPLARGFLTRPHDELEATVRGETDRHLHERLTTYAANGGREINERVAELAEEKGVKMAQIALAWLLHQDAVDAPIVGARKPEYVVDAVEALDVDLSDSDLDWLAEPYEPVPIDGHS